MLERVDNGVHAVIRAHDRDADPETAPEALGDVVDTAIAAIETPRHED